MRTTLNIDAELLAEAERLTRIFPMLLSALVRSHPVRLRNKLLSWMSLGRRGLRG
jgi:hypothetical protein